LPELDAAYDPQALAVDDGAIYVSAYRSDSLGVRRGPRRVIRIDLETGGSTGHVDVPSPCGHAGGLAVGGASEAKWRGEMGTDLVQQTSLEGSENDSLDEAIGAISPNTSTR
jgi:hypothetical protein